MRGVYPFCNRITLAGKTGRISTDDAERQEKTAREILARFAVQPGVILADEVGMGKTFVALAVAISVALVDKEKRPVVVMVPSSLKQKWPRDFNFFLEECLPPELSGNVRAKSAERGVDFLKLLDDPPEKRAPIIFLTHGAMNRSLNDGWVKLALIQRAIYRRHGSDSLRRAIAKIAGRLLRMPWVDRKSPGVWLELLSNDTGKWLEILRRHTIDPENDNDQETDDDPVPEAVVQALDSTDTTPIFEALQGVPRYETKLFETRLDAVRKELKKELQSLWKACLVRLSIKLPLLIMDEAHHLKNAQTNLARLFNNEDAEAFDRGELGNIFERMLFLTATPFELGHHELCSVLDRFQGICWDGGSRLAVTRQSYQEKMLILREQLDVAQRCALMLDKAWGRLAIDDLRLGDKSFVRPDAWWDYLVSRDSMAVEDLLTERSADFFKTYTRTSEAMRTAENALKPWIIRHAKSRELPVNQKCTVSTRKPKLIKRRMSFHGRAIQKETNQHSLVHEPPQGIAVKEEALLPFLLATRAAAMNPESRPVFAEGLASSYEAFLRSHTDTDDEQSVICSLHDPDAWYLDKLKKILPKMHDTKGASSHPKIAATVKKAMELWKQGEKVVVFCHYIATGKSLRRHISSAMAHEIKLMGYDKLACDHTIVDERLEQIGKRFFDEDSPLRYASDEHVTTLLNDYGCLLSDHERISRVVRRYLRTPSFLVRYFPLQESRMTRSTIRKALETSDGSGLKLNKILTEFFQFLSTRNLDERNAYLHAIDRLQTGSHAGKELDEYFSADELQEDSSDKLLPNVRLVNGSTHSNTRQRLMLTFNTPFYPEILIASNVMAEGVDLHLNCRHIIHHDLSWNPSMLEQRTGRIDRIGAKAEKCGKSIHVYIPYIAETQDEKMYRVVMDRESWFKVVMGEKVKFSMLATDDYSERLAVPDSLIESLMFDLSVYSPKAIKIPC